MQSFEVEGEGAKRQLRPRFITAYDQKGAALGEFQAHRRVLGLLYLHWEPSCNGIGAGTSFDALRQGYQEAKDEWKQCMFDSRCISFGTSVANGSVAGESEYIQYGSGEDAGLEADVAEFLRSIFWVLESKRLDRAFEKLDAPPCPAIRDEEKYRFGLENKQSKNYRKKCLGRLRKQVGDFHLLTGLPAAALDVYVSAIDYLKGRLMGHGGASNFSKALSSCLDSRTQKARPPSVSNFGAANDWLWLGGAYEGWATAAMACRWGGRATKAKPTSLSRVASYAGTSLLHHHSLTRSSSGERLEANGSPSNHRSRGHSRNASSGAALAAAEPQGGSLPHSASTATFFTPKDDVRSSGALIHPSEILERFRLAIENYEKFSLAAKLECECIIKASAVYRYQREYCDMECYLRESTGKFLDSGFTAFSHIYKSWLCSVLAVIFRGVGFGRKAAFFLRLAALFCLHPPGNDPPPPTVEQYQHVYPILHGTLRGCGLRESSRDIPLGFAKGWVEVQVRSLHEVYLTALRAGYPDAAIRHLAFLLQGYLEDLDQKFAESICGDLMRLCSERELPFPLDKALDLPAANIFLPPVALSKIPKLLYSLWYPDA